MRVFRCERSVRLDAKRFDQTDRSRIACKNSSLNEHFGPFRIGVRIGNDAAADAHVATTRRTIEVGGANRDAPLPATRPIAVADRAHCDPARCTFASRDLVHGTAFRGTRNTAARKECRKNIP